MPAYLLDSDVVIEALRGRNASLTGLLADIEPDGLAISVVSYGEVFEGILYGPRRAQRLQQWKQFLAGYDVVDVTLEIAEYWADLRGSLRTSGRMLPDADLLIASTAQRFNLTLVTRTARHFSGISGLDLLAAS